MLIEQSQGNPPSQQYKVEELGKILAKEQSIKIVQEMRNSIGRPLPSKSYCKSFCESLPSIHEWKITYENIER